MRGHIADEDLPAFVTYLALGTFEAIRAGTVPATVGIWTLGRPIFWEPLEDGRLMPPEVLEVLKLADELSALREVAPKEFDVRLTKIISQLHGALARMPSSTWRMEWTRRGESS